MKTFNSIALLANAQVRYLMLDIARELKARHGSEIHLYCWTPQEVQFYQKENRDQFAASINLAPTLHNLALEPVPDPDMEFANARRIEKEIGRTYNSLAVANRHLGRGYALGGFYHPRSRHSAQSSHESLVHAYNRHFKYWEEEIQARGLCLLLGGPAEMPSVARRHGIPYRRLAGSRHKNLHFWTFNEFNECQALPDAYEQIARDDACHEDIDFDRPYKLVGTADDQFHRDLKIVALLKKLSHFAARRVYWRVRRYEKARGYLLRDELRFALRKWKHSRRMMGGDMVRLSDLEGQSFVFFPVATEPEVALQQFSPEFFFQHAAIAALSRDLPAGVKLVVKESVVGVGRRPDNFYEQIAELKNVVWMDIREPGFSVARQADAVAVITGSTGFEAAVMGTPVISLGAHNPYNILPHVFHFTDLARTGEAIRTIFDGGVDKAEAKRAGAAYLQAVIDTSFDLGSYDYVDLRSHDRKSVSDACHALAEGLKALPITTPPALETV